jgi:hypothetical protein
VPCVGHLRRPRLDGVIEAELARAHSDVFEAVVRLLQALGAQSNAA